MNHPKIFVLVAFVVSLVTVGERKCLLASDTFKPPKLSSAELESEKMLGNLESAVMLQGNMLLIAPELEQRVQHILSRLVSAVNMTTQIRLFILNTPLVGAWGCPNGDIIITSGLLTVVENTDQLAVVLGHELGHLNSHDGYMKLVEEFSRREAVSRIGQILVGMAAGAGSSVTATLLQSVPIEGPVNSALYNQIVVQILSDYSGRIVAYAGSEVAMAILASQLSMYSQSQEFNADILGIRYVAKAGYDAKKGSQIFVKLRELEQKKDVKNRRN